MQICDDELNSEREKQSLFCARGLLDGPINGASTEDWLVYVLVVMKQRMCTALPYVVTIRNISCFGKIVNSCLYKNTKMLRK